jgi:hypothetical protein
MTLKKGLSEKTPMDHKGIPGYKVKISPDGKRVD